MPCEASAMALVFAGKAVATAAISFWINKAFTYLKEYKVEGIEDIKNRLLQSMPKIQVVLDIVNPRYVKEQSSALDAWLWQLRYAVEEAEDVIDVLEYYKLKEMAKDHKKLDITCCCKELEEKVGVNESPEWNNISHIARVHIGDSYFMDGKKCSEETLDRQQ
uniref:Disease resistance N-terminal domain-containing protein n=1 Tax=Oryza meridionalis TaxID=40149 RepID=A0A0E0DGA6_9ORYZ